MAFNSRDLEGVQNSSELVSLLRALIDDGTFNDGERIPPIREIARATTLAPGTVAKSISQLTKDGLLITEGRGGTKVRSRTSLTSPRPRLFSMIPKMVAPGVIDLSNGFPDSRLFIPIAALLDLDLSHFEINNYLTPPVLADLKEVIEERFEIGEKAITITNGSLEAIDRIVGTSVRSGGRVAIEDPTFPPLIDILDRHKIKVYPLEMDVEGVVVSSLLRAIQGGIDAVIFQLRCHNPTGVTTSTERLAEIAEVLAQRGVLVIEDDHSGLTRTTDDRTLSNLEAVTSVRVVGFSKLYGPDLRIAAVIGPSELVDRINEDRRLGPSWTSHLIQRLLARLMEHDHLTMHNEEVAKIYRMRMHKLVGALSAPNQIASWDGLNTWIPTTSESALVADLARVGIAAAPGSIFQASPSARCEYIRLTTASLDAIPEALLEIVDKWLPDH